MCYLPLFRHSFSLFFFLSLSFFYLPRMGNATIRIYSITSLDNNGERSKWNAWNTCARCHECTPPRVWVSTSEMRSGGAPGVQWLTSKVTPQPKSVGGARMRAEFNGLHCDWLPLQPPLSCSEPKQQGNSDFRVFDIFVIHSLPDPFSIFSFRGSVQSWEM